MEAPSEPTGMDGSSGAGPSTAARALAVVLAVAGLAVISSGIQAKLTDPELTRDAFSASVILGTGLVACAALAWKGGHDLSALLLIAAVAVLAGLILGPQAAPGLPSLGRLWSRECMTMTPLVISSYYYPDEPIILEGAVSNADGSPVKHASVGAVVTCVSSSMGAGQGGCAPGAIVCQVDPRCGMCACLRTDNWGAYKLSLKSPVAAGDYRLKLVVVGDQRTNCRISEEAEFTVG